MKPKKLKNIIRKVQGDLLWPVAIERGGPVLQIASDHWDKTHTIYLPATDVRDNEYLHELGHATLCETIHPVFSTNYFGRETPAAWYPVLEPVFQSASDWFVDAWLMRVAPEWESAAIDESVGHAGELLRRLGATGQIEPQHGLPAAMLVAESVYHRGARNVYTGSFGRAVSAYLAAKPERPTLAKYSSLINSLLGLFGLSAEYSLADDCWVVRER